MAHDLRGSGDRPEATFVAVAAEAVGYASNELRNEPIRRLNVGLGYREAPGRVLMRGPLLSG